MHFMRRINQRRLLIGSSFLLLAALALLGFRYGPEVLGYYRFMQAVEVSSKQSTTIAGAWPRLSDVCMPCHGPNGNPTTQRYPRLAGQPATYLARQLTVFAEGERHSPVMSPLALSLSADEISRLTSFFAAQPVIPNAAFSADPARLNMGELLVKEKGCEACHGAGLRGQETLPRLAGQGQAYLAKQLFDFRNGARRDPQGAMTAIARTLSDEDIENLASYLASYRTSGHSR